MAEYGPLLSEDRLIADPSAFSLGDGCDPAPSPRGRCLDLVQRLLFQKIGLPWFPVVSRGTNSAMRLQFSHKMCLAVQVVESVRLVAETEYVAPTLTIRVNWSPGAESAVDWCPPCDCLC